MEHEKVESLAWDIPAVRIKSGKVKLQDIDEVLEKGWEGEDKNNRRTLSEASLMLICN